MRYARKGSHLKYKLLRQLPGLRQAVKNEQKWLEDFTRRHSISGVVSDNRYGLYQTRMPSVILTHQLQIQSGMGTLADRLLRVAHYRQLRSFQEIWVVDRPQDGLAGALSHPATLPCRTHYAGLLSQFAGMDTTRLSGIRRHLLILLSGPEPQRTLLSDLLWEAVQNLSQPVIFVEGKKNCHRTGKTALTHHDQLQGTDLLEALTGAALVICRSGYSSIMDLACLGQRAILIPTPGQTEQAYLGKELSRKQLFPSFPQANFSLSKALAAATKFPFRQAAQPEDFRMFEPLLHRWLQQL